MRIQRNCKVCHTPFTAIKETQIFCRRACFKRDYYLRKKAETSKDAANPKFPLYSCGLCETKTQLDFDPIKHLLLFENYKCPNCNVRKRDLWQHNVHFVFTYSQIDVVGEFGNVSTHTFIVSTSPIQPSL